MKKRIITLLCAIAALLPLTTFAAPGSWRLHPSFDNNPEKVIATPFGAYMFALAEPYASGHSDYADRQGFLYRYDSAADEFEFLSSGGRLSETVIDRVEYNPKEKFLLVVYSSSNIDLIHDNGEVENIPGLLAADIKVGKGVRDITFDADRHRAYLAADFGYLVLNTERGEVDRSFIINEPVKSAARWQDEVLILKDGVMYASKADKPRLTMDDFRKVLDVPSATRLLPLTADICVLQAVNDVATFYYFIERGADGWNLREITNSNRTFVEYAPEGIIVGSGAQFIYIKPQGVAQTVTRLNDDFSTLGTTRDMKEFWYARGREGLYSRRYDSEAQTKWTTTRNPMMPDASSAFKSASMVWHPKYGLLVSNHGIDLNFSSFNYKMPVLLSALKDGRWVRHGLPYTNPAQTSALSNPNGLAVDPDNSDMVYFGSIFNGILRMDLSNPENILHMGSSYDPARNLPGFVEMAKGNPWWTEHFKFSAPVFDADGNLWAGYYDSQESENNKNPQIQIWYWPSADRKASTSSASFRPWKKWVLKGLTPSQNDKVLPLRHRDNKNLVVYAPNYYQSPILILDHKGTLDNDADDQYVLIDRPVNQDGTSLDLFYATALFEDQETGNLWVGTSTGLFTINPVKAFANPNSVNNIKVSRDDGTDLADYLFNGSKVNDIISDPQGRKWFALDGGGVTVTSSDGRRVLLELTSENSSLPSDIVYSLCYNPDNHSVMMSTFNGLAEYFPSGEGATGEDLESVRAYPNPVRSDYYGYVTIDGLVDNALVKIMDAHGNLVKEFDLAENGEVKWDVTNMAHKRVKTGVYYILSSSGPGDSSLSNVGKILVVN